MSSVCGLSSKMNMRRVLAAPRGRGRELRGQRRLAGARRADDQRARALLDAAAEQRVELRHAARQLAPRVDVWRCSAATSRGKTDSAAALDHVVVIAAAELHSRDT